MKRLSILTASLLISSAASLTAEGSVIYEFDLSGGAFPTGTEMANLNGVFPDKEAYKHGYVQTGWTIDRLDNKGYVALSPTYNTPGNAAQNLLKLPIVEVTRDMVLEWEARSVYRHFPDSYYIMAWMEDGSEPVLLYETEKENWSWSLHRVSLNALEGKKVRIGFVCTSKEGYILALSGVRLVADSLHEDVESSIEEDSEFTRSLVVDKATGMWCVNCPEGEMAVEQLQQRFGKRLIVLNTHVNDVLANTPYWEQLKWYSVPRMMLNRIKATEGENAKKFEDYYNLPTPFSITAQPPAADGGNFLKVTAGIKVAEAIDNSSDRYRIGFVVTGDFHKADDPRFRQKNNCTQPAYGAFYFLPSEIPSALMYYEEVTLTSETAFTGIENSLPASLIPDETYETEWRFESPALLENPAEAQVVALVLDTLTGEIMNGAVGEDPSYLGVEAVLASSGSSALISGGGDGMVTTTLEPGESYRLEVFAADGSLLLSSDGVAAGADSFMLPSRQGMMVVRLSTPRISQTVKIMR